MDTDSIALKPVGVAELDRLRELWLELHSHHQAIAPELAPYVEDERSWSARRALYVHVLERGGFALRATDGVADVGYLLAARTAHPWPALFPATEEVWELLTLVVQPGRRGEGIGALLFDAFEGHMQSSSTNLAMIGLLPGNTGALRFYERRGFAPMWLTLTRFLRGPEPNDGPVAGPRPVGVEDVDSLRPLWLAELERHREGVPALAPYTSPERSWGTMRQLLCRAAQEQLLWHVRDPDGGASGFISGHVGDDTLWADAWQTAPRVGEIDTIAIVPGERDEDTRHALLHAIDEGLSAAGVSDRAAGVPASDGEAIETFRRRGYRPAWLQVTRFH